MTQQSSLVQCDATSWSVTTLVPARHMVWTRRRARTRERLATRRQHARRRFQHACTQARRVAQTVALPACRFRVTGCAAEANSCAHAAHRQSHLASEVACHLRGGAGACDCRSCEVIHQGRAGHCGQGARAQSTASLTHGPNRRHQAVAPRHPMCVSCVAFAATAAARAQARMSRPSRMRQDA